MSVLQKRVIAFYFGNARRFFIKYYEVGYAKEK